MPFLTAEERVGTTVGGKYRLERIIGRGGMATVFEATHVVNHRRVAMKLLHPEFAVDAEVVRRFVTEARTAASLDHPNAVSVLDTGQDTDGTPYLVLELLHGETLAQLLARRGSLTYDEVLSIAGPVLDALSAAHARGIVHRDIKPDNVFLATDASGHTTPKLLDFGIAKVADATRTQTATGQALGTPYYMSPEQVESKGAVGPWSDVWSMGVVLYQCLTGAVPFHAETLPGVFVAILTTQAPSLASQGVLVTPAVAAVIDRTLMRDPAARYASANELAAALTAAAHVKLVRRPKKRRSAALIVGVLALLLVAGGAAATYLYREQLLALAGSGPPGGVPAAVVPVSVVPVVPLDVATPPSDAGAAVDAGVTAVATADADADAAAQAQAALGQLEGLGPEEAELAQQLLPQLLGPASRCRPDDPLCMVEAAQGGHVAEPYVRLIVETTRRRSPAEARPWMQGYVQRFPNGPMAAQYRRLLADPSATPAPAPPTRLRRPRPSGVH